MIKFERLSGAFALGLLLCSMATGQSQEPPRFSRDFCVKVRDGKGAEYAAFLRDVSVKLAKVRVDAGTMASYTVAQAVAPAGRSARCDYHLVSIYAGFPPEAPSPEQTAADMKKAGIAMSREAMIAKRDELSFLVSMDIWRWQERVGTAGKGGYARLNYYKVKPGATVAEWSRMESTGWKQLAEVLATEMPGTAWRSATLVMPGGTSLPYSGLTVDVFPSWEALGKGIPARATWNKVHPERDMAAYTERMATIVDRPRTDIVKLIEVIGK